MGSKFLLLSGFLSTPESSYRIFVGAFVSGRLAETIQTVRLRWDPKTARITLRMSL